MTLHYTLLDVLAAKLGVFCNAPNLPGGNARLSPWTPSGPIRDETFASYGATSFIFFILV